MSELLILFLTYFKIGLFAFGGGYAAVPLIKEEIVLKYGYITLEQFTDIITLAEMTPGPIAINTATFVGTSVGGIFGAIVATLGFITPSVIICITLAYFFFRYKNVRFVSLVLSLVKPVIIGIIGSAAFTIFKTAIFVNGNYLDVNLRSVFIFTVSAFLIYKKKYSVTKILPIAAVLGIILYM